MNDFSRNITLIMFFGGIALGLVILIASFIYGFNWLYSGFGFLGTVLSLFNN